MMKYGIGKFEETELVKVPGYDDIEDVREYVTGPIGKRGERLKKWLLPKRDGVYVIAYTLNKNGSVVRIFGNKYVENRPKGDHVSESIYFNSITLNAPSKGVWNKKQ
jgi:hypothetical protein